MCTETRSWWAVVGGLVVAALVSACGSGPTSSRAIRLVDDVPRLLPRVTFVAPSEGEVLHTDELAWIFASYNFPRLDPTAGLQGTVVARGEAGELPIAEGILGSLMDPAGVSVRWDLSTVPPGSYELVLRLSEPRSNDVVRRVTVRDPPAVDVGLASFGVGDRGYSAVFTADARSEGAEVSRYLWTFGDGSGTQVSQEPTVEHTYLADGPRFDISVEAQDSLGGTTLWNGTLQLAGPPGAGGWEEYRAGCGAEDGRWPWEDGQLPPCVPEAFLTPAAECGCEQIEIRQESRPDLRRSFPYCVDQNFDAGSFFERYPSCALLTGAPPFACPPGEIPFVCDLGPSLPNRMLDRAFFGFGFEIVADLGEGSVAAACEEGQYAHSSRTFNGVPRPPLQSADGPASGIQVFPRDMGGPLVLSVRPNGDPVPPVEFPEFGADNYHRPSLLKRYFPTSLRWLDFPGIRGGPVFGATITQDDEFVSFVRGTPGQRTCWCRFRIRQTLSASGELGGEGFELVDQNRCAATPTNAQLLGGGGGFDAIDTGLWELIVGADYFDGPEAYPPQAEPGPEALLTRNPLLFMPGVLGSMLWREDFPGGHYWDLDSLVWPPLQGRALDDLDIRNNLIADGVVPVVYTPLILYLDRLGYRRLGPDQDFWIHAYDWRRDNGENAGLLIDRIREILDSDQAKRKGWTQVDIIGHSMAGLQMRAAANAGAPIDKMIFLASPHFGSAEAYLTLHPAFDPPTDQATVFRSFAGDPLAKKVGALFGEELRQRLRDLARQYPSVYQLLLDSRYLRTRSLVPGVRGAASTYFQDGNGVVQPWNFPDEQLFEVYAALLFKALLGEQLPMSTRNLVFYNDRLGTNDTADFSTTPPTSRDSGQRGDVTVPTDSARLFGDPRAVRVRGDHRQIPNNSLEVWPRIRAHLAMP